jgi:hypothetical protein
MSFINAYNYLFKKGMFFFLYTFNLWYSVLIQQYIIDNNIQSQLICSSNCINKSDDSVLRIVGITLCVLLNYLNYLTIAEFWPNPVNPGPRARENLKSGKSIVPNQ